MGKFIAAHPEEIGFCGLSRSEYIRSMVRIQGRKEKAYAYDNLTQEEREDIVEINGHRYIRALAPGCV